MKNTPRKLLIWLLIGAMGSAALTACAEQTQEEGAATGTEEATAVETAEDMDSLEARKRVSDGLEERDFEGQKLRTVLQNSTITDYWAEEMSGDALEDAIYQRNQKVSERFNITFEEPVLLAYNEISPHVRKVINAQDDAYDLVFGQMEQSGQDALNGLFQNWHDIPYLNFSQPWYPKSILENAASVNGTMFSLISDMSISCVDRSHMLIFNKNLAADYNLPDLYDLVRQGSWTIDQLIEINRNLYVDVNSNSRPDDKDFYGLRVSEHGTNILALLYGFNQKLVTITEDLTVDMVFNCEKSVSIVEKLHEMYYDIQGISPKYGDFLKRGCLFNQLCLYTVYRDYRDFEDDYGMLPMPKWEESQERYYTSIDAGSSVMVVPVTAAETDLIGYVTEALSCESWKSVLPLYYDIVLNTKSVRDEQSIEMMDIIVSSREVDFASLHNAWGGWVFELPKFVQTGNFASTYKTQEKKMTRFYDKMIDSFLID